MKKKKICIITGTRAEYGLLSNLMKHIKKDSAFKLQIIATGMHLSPEFGMTYKEIEKDGFNIDYKIEMLLSNDTPSAISKSMALGLVGFSDSFNQLNPDIIIVLGDRFEILSASIAATFSRIPIAHLSGGESTVGAYDESIRHSITKMSWWHFVANKKYLKRVIQLGENPQNVFNVGGLGVDIIKNTKLLTKIQLEKKLGIKFKKKNLLITYHPVTLEKKSPKSFFQSLLNILNKLDDTLLIFTMPNADTNSRIIKRLINDFVFLNKDKSISFDSMGQLNYLSTLQFVDAVIGNSSSGLAEAPTFKIGTVNIGDRQKGRLKANSVIDCEPSKTSIMKSLKKLYSKDFQNKLLNVDNPYGEGDASSKITKILKKQTIPNNPKKEFYDL